MAGQKIVVEKKKKKGALNRLKKGTSVVCAVCVTLIRGVKC